jgi:hypothetical protein
VFFNHSAPDRAFRIQLTKCRQTRQNVAVRSWMNANGPDTQTSTAELSLQPPAGSAGPRARLPHRRGRVYFEFKVTEG